MFSLYKGYLGLSDEKVYQAIWNEFEIMQKRLVTFFRMITTLHAMLDSLISGRLSSSTDGNGLMSNCWRYSQIVLHCSMIHEVA